MIEDGIEIVDGVYYFVDVIVYGIGFVVIEFLLLMCIMGCGGLDLNDVW